MDPRTVRERYTVIAPRYDNIVGRYTRLVLYPMQRYRRLAVESLRLSPGATVLDIGCGTGLNFPLIEDKIGPSGQVIGIDYTPAMLEQAAGRVERAGWRNVELFQGDAGDVAALVDSGVDAALSTFCLCIVPRWQEAIAGTAALLRPGGRLAVLDAAKVKLEGPLALFNPLVRWWTKHYGFADPERDFVTLRPWRETMEKYLLPVRYEEMYFGTMFLCCGEKVEAR